MAAVVDHRAEDLAAGAVGHRVIQKQRGVGVLTAVEQIDAVGLDAGALAGKRYDCLVAAHARPTGHAEGVEVRLCAQRHQRRGNVEGLAAVLDQTHMVKPRAVAGFDGGLVPGPRAGRRARSEGPARGCDRRSRHTR